MMDRTYSLIEMGDEPTHTHSIYYRISEDGGIVRILRLVGDITGRVVFDESFVSYRHAHFLTEAQKDEMISILEAQARLEPMPALLLSVKREAGRLTEEDERKYRLEIKKYRDLQALNHKKRMLTD